MLKRKLQKLKTHLSSFNDADRKSLEDRYNCLISYINHDFGDSVTGYRNKFSQVTKMLDNYRNESLITACPELELLYNEFK